MRIAILVNESKSIFTNGCLQQGYFLLKSFRKLGYQCNFVSASDSFTKFEVVNEDVLPIKSSKDLDLYNVIVFSSGSIDNHSYMSYCKLNNIIMINLCVGNYYVINQEEFVFDLHKSNNVMARMYNKFIDRIWLMPMYSHNINYMKFITKTPLDISPYVWDSTFIDEYSQKKGLNTIYNPNKKQLDILILEPNVSIHKTALIPLLIAEQFYMENPDKLGKIYLFCKPKGEFRNRLWYLNIFKNDRVEFFDRIISMDLFDNLNNLGKKYVVLSSNIRNGLNFLHLECFKLKIPIIHNCKPFKTSGLYYQEDDVQDNYPIAIKHLLDVYSGDYNQQVDDILELYNPYNDKNTNNYKELIESISTKEKSILNQIVDNLKNENKKYELKNTVAVVFLADDQDDISIINSNVEYIKNIMKNCLFYVIDNSNIGIKPSCNFNVVKIKNSRYILQEIYTKILHRDIIVVNSGFNVRFDVNQIINKGDLVGIQIEKEKELNEYDYNYYESILNTVELLMPKNNGIKIFDFNFFMIKNSSNIINGIKNIGKISNLDDLCFNNIIFQLFYDNRVSLVQDRVLIYSPESNIIGKGYSSNSSVILYKSYNNTDKKIVINDDKLYKFIDKSFIYHQY